MSDAAIGGHATVRYARGALYGLAAVSIWSAWIVVARLGLRTSLTPWDIAALRFGVAGNPFAAVCAGQGACPRTSRRYRAGGDRVWRCRTRAAGQFGIAVRVRRPCGGTLSGRDATDGRASRRGIPAGDIHDGKENWFHLDFARCSWDRLRFGWRHRFIRECWRRAVPWLWTGMGFLYDRDASGAPWRIACGGHLSRWGYAPVSAGFRAHNWDNARQRTME